MSADFEKFCRDFDEFIFRIIRRSRKQSRNGKSRTQIEFTEDIYIEFLGYCVLWTAIKVAYLRDHPFPSPPQRWRIKVIELNIDSFRDILEGIEIILESGRFGDDDYSV